MRNLIISGVGEGSIAQEAGIEAGDRLISMNGQPIGDVFDYRFLSAEEEVLLEVCKPDGEVLQVEIEKDEWEDIGLSFEKPLLDDEKSCRNNCIFCFIDQLPKGMRPSLYYKDDDARLSFLYGNYITMTNMKQEELERIVRYRMSPVNISVHTTNPQLRVSMLNNRFAGDLLPKMRYLAEQGILLNAQIVLCRGVNDAEELDKTLADLAELMPALNSISIVPVGLTRFRSGLPVLQPFDRDSALSVIQQAGRWQELFLKTTDSRKVYLSDEWYLMSGKELPDYSHYEDFPQIENGVGMAASFLQEFDEALSRRRKKNVNRTVSLVTGVLAGGIITEAAHRAVKSFPGLKIFVYPIENHFFGNTVTVTGLLTGTDILEQLRGKPLGDMLLLPSNMFRAGTEIFLDDLSMDEISHELAVGAKKVEPNGTAFLKALLG
jgi:putative radical SAM enzyme (TIGR03279 family)